MIEAQVRLIETKFYAEGYCWGKYWGGGEGGYEATQYEAKTMQELEEMINSGIKDGSIDGGMGFEQMLGARMSLRSVTHIEIKDSNGFDGEYQKVEHFADKSFGDLSDEAEECLTNIF